MMTTRLREIAKEEETKLVMISSLKQSRLFQEAIAVDTQGVTLITNSMTHLTVQPTESTPEADAGTYSPCKARCLRLMTIEQTVFFKLRGQMYTNQATKISGNWMMAREISICRAQGGIL